MGVKLQYFSSAQSKLKTFVFIQAFSPSAQFIEWFLGLVLNFSPNGHYLIAICKCSKYGDIKDELGGWENGYLKKKFIWVISI